MKRFYVWWWQDAGVPMYCHALISAESKRFAKSNWVNLVRGEGKACNPATSSFEGLEEVPDHATLSWCSKKFN